MRPYSNISVLKGGLKARQRRHVVIAHGGMALNWKKVDLD